MSEFSPRISSVGTEMLATACQPASGSRARTVPGARNARS